MRPYRLANPHPAPKATATAGVFLSLCLFAQAHAHAASAATTFAITPDTARIGYDVRCFRIFACTGVFKQFNGTFTLDPTAQPTGHMQVVISAASIASIMPAAGAVLRSAAFFDTAHFPVMTYTSTTITALEPGHYAVIGELTMRGVTRALVMDATDDAHGAVRAQAVLHRADFGMAARSVMIGDAVGITIVVQLANTLARPSGGGQNPPHEQR